MAKNQEPAKPVGYETDSTVEESDDETSSEDESDSEPELTQIAKTPSSSTPAAAKKTLLQSASKPESSFSSEEESGSDSDGPNPKPRPMETKPINGAHKSLNGARKPRPEPAASKLGTPTESAAGKRRSEENETRAKDSKKAKLVKTPSDESRSESESDSDCLSPEVRAKETKPMSGTRKSLNRARKSQSEPAAGKRQAEEKETLAKGSKKPTNQVHRARKPRHQPTKSTGTNDSKKTKAGKRLTGNSKKPPSQRNKKEEDKILILPGMINHPAKNKSVGGSVEEMILTMGDKMFSEGKGAEEWKRLKLEEREVYLMRLDVKTKQTKLEISTLKSG